MPIADRGEPPRSALGRRVAALAVRPAADRALSTGSAPGAPGAVPRSGIRPAIPTYAPAGSHTGFADGFPLLVTSEGSLAELNAALAERAPSPSR